MTSTGPPAVPDTVAGDAVAVGHEIGHIRADGTIIGRAEPYAKVFPSSRQVKRAVGVMAWAILEDIALDARIDHAGRLVAATNVRRIAANLGVSKNTVARHLTRLRDAGFVLHEEGDHDDTGRYTVSRYVLDPSACVERFTHTPSRHDPDDDHVDDSSGQVHHPGDAAALERDTDRDPVTANPDIHSPVDDHLPVDLPESVTDDGFRPCTSFWDTVDATVSQSVGHRELGHKNKEEVVVQREQHRAREDPPTARVDDAVASLAEAGVTPTRATDLARRHPPDRIADVLDAVTAQPADNPPGWITAALDGDWDIHDLAVQVRNQRRQHRHRAAQRAARQHADDAADLHARIQHHRNQGWADIAAHLLDDDQLGRLIEHLRDPRFPRSNRSTRLTTAQITGWVAGACHRHPDLKPDRAIARSMGNPDSIDHPETLPPPPTSNTPTRPLDRRVAALLPLLNEEQQKQVAPASTLADSNGQAA